jgi:phosphate-selective porin OprO/OprP
MDTDLGLFMTDINTFFLDAVFKYRGISVMAEYADRKADDRIARNSDGTVTGDEVRTGHGLNMQMGYLMKKDWEVAARFSQLELDTADAFTQRETQYTLGLSKYIVGHKLKVQSDISYLDLDNDADVLMCRLQLDVHF